jgi:hypothetical protein
MSWLGGRASATQRDDHGLDRHPIRSPRNTGDSSRDFEVSLDIGGNDPFILRSFSDHTRGALKRALRDVSGQR